MNLKRIASKIISQDSASIIESKKYYRNENKILETGVKGDGGPLRNADNRIPHNFHEILVDEKASYLFTYPPVIDIDNNTSTNEKVNEVLGEEFPKKLKNQCIEASNCGKSWIHYWINEKVNETQIIEDRKFKYALVPTEQIIPLYGNGLEETLESIIRHYIVYEYDEAEEKDIAYKYIEYWTNTEWVTYKLKNDSAISEDNLVEPAKIITHALGEVPFIQFNNNLKCQSDLSKYKALIDLIDRVMSGFANDLDDIQQVIYILENYGGTDLAEFLSDLKKYKAVKTDEGGGVKPLQIEIPVEARKIIIDILEKRIYEAGQGLQQDVESVGNASGTALKFFYRKLELKSGLCETEFRGSINKLVKAILKYLNLSYTKINQTWTRNMISNDLEMAEICQKSVGIVPQELIDNYHPLIDDKEQAKRLRQEEKDEQKRLFEDNYSTLGTKEEADLVE